MQCITPGCKNEAEYDGEGGTDSWFSRCSRCAAFSGDRSGESHMHRSYLGNGKWTETECTRYSMSLVAIDAERRWLTFACTAGFCDVRVRRDLDEYMDRDIERQQALIAQSYMRWAKRAA
jgi:hypothetical protein